MDEQNELINSNQKRSASDALRGYTYQLWQSVYEWLHLQDEERLYLEGAEDIDKYSTNNVETIQIKDTQQSGSITLRSEGVIDAINNFWQLKIDNSSVNISFRYITTSNVGFEAGKPFGQTQGIVLWNQLKFSDQENIERIRKFILGEKTTSENDRFSAEVVEFASSATAQELFDSLIDPIKWFYNQPNLESVVEYVNNTLIEQGNRFNIIPTEAKKVATVLYQKALEYAISKKAIFLRKAQYLEIFEATTFTLVPNNIAQAFFSGSIGFSSIDQIKSLVPELFYEVPEIRFTFFDRKSVVSRLVEVINDKDFLFINGLSGSGKTTLAKAAAKVISKNWLWIGLGGIRAEHTIQQAISYLISVVYQSQSINKVIIDDLTLGSNARIIENKVEELAYLLVKHRKGKLVITSIDKLSPSLKMNLGIKEECFFSVPNFSNDEISELLEFFGLSDKDKALHFARIIYAKTRGHIQLIHAYVKHLKESEFTDPIDTVILNQPSEISDLKRSALHAIANLYDESTRDFIFRLTLISGLFTKDQALRIGRHQPTVINPGLIFNKVTGAWIEPVGSEYFRISPLIENTAQEIYDSSAIKELHVTIVSAVLDSRKISFSEYVTAFFHSWSAQDEDTLRRTAIAALSQHNNIFWKNLSEHFFWIANRYIDEPFELFPKSRIVNNLLRVLQYKIAAHTNKENAIRICHLMDKETALTETTLDIEAYLSRVQFIFIVVALSEPVKLGSSYLLKLILELEAITGQLSELSNLNESPIVSDRISELMGNSKSDISSLFLMIIPRCISFQDLDELLYSIDALSPSNRNFLFKRVAESDFLNGFWINLTINNESKIESPNWDSALTILKKWIDKAVHWNLPKFSGAMIKGAAHIYVEFFKDFDSAYEICESAPLSLRNSFVVLNSKANVLFYKQDYVGSLKIWRDILIPNLLTDDPFTIYSYRSAAIAESKISEFRRSFNYLITGYNLSEKIPELKQSLGYKVDAAYCLWKLDEYQNFLELMFEVMAKLETIHNDSRDIANYGLHKTIGHSLCWYMARIKGEVVDLFEPVVGICSNPNLNEDILKLNQTPIEYSWLNLITIEFEIGYDDKILKNQYERLSASGFPMVRKQIYSFRVERTFHSNPGLIVELCANIVRESALEKSIGKDFSKEVSPSKYFDLTPTDREAITANSLVYIAFFLLYENSHNAERITNVVESLLSENKHLKCYSLFEQLEELKSLTSLDNSDLIACLQNPSKTYYLRIFSAILIMNCADGGNEVFFYSHATIFKFLLDVKSIKISLDPIVSKIEKYWRRSSLNPAFIRLPRENVPKILAACDSSVTGFKKIASILIATYNGVNLTVDETTLDFWRSQLL